MLCYDRMRQWCFCFFSSRRRHTRCSRDWSSDVCSSDLGIENVEHDHLVVAVPEVLKPAQHVGGLVHEIGAQHDQPAALDALGELVERGSEPGAPGGLGGAQGLEQHV